MVRKPQVSAIWRHDLTDLERRDHQTFVAKARRIAIPGHRYYPGGRARPKAGQVDVDGAIRMLAVDTDRLALNPEDPARLFIHPPDFACLPPAKRPLYRYLAA